MSAIVVMGSGETAPTMVKVHREVFAVSGEGPAVLLDTPFGFQMNADELTARTLGYFSDSVGHRVEVAPWRRSDAPVVERERSLALIGRARWAFAGPGSPTYALRHWQGTPVPGALIDVVRRGGTLVLGSAAAVTLGTHAVPVYEIYKAGDEPAWAEGLDLLGGLTRLRAAVVPHYDNAEGGTHDTRFCYLGEQRLSRLELELPDDVGVLGVDEHTALWLDLETRQASVRGNGVVTARRRGTSTTFADRQQISFDDLGALLRGEATQSSGEQGARAAPTAPASSTDTASEQPTSSLRAAADVAREGFDRALAARDVEGCVAAVLGLEQAIRDWSADTLQSDDVDVARQALRSMVVRLGELAGRGARDPREAVAPLVETLLDVRAGAREARDYATSDLVRDRLVAAGVQVRDTPDGVEWVLDDSEGADAAR